VSKVIAVFGAGPGRGVALARRFGREGFRVALVARREDRLEELAEQLRGEGIEAATFSADLGDPAGVPALISAIRADFGRIDVAEYGPIGMGRHFVPVTEVDADTMRNYLPLLLLTPIEVVRALLPEWTERGDGTFLLTHGASAVHPLPGISGTGAIMAAARSYLYSLNAGLAGTGVYAATLAIAGLISGSEIGATLSDSPSDADSLAAHLPVIDPAALADQYWDMYTTRDRVEVVYPEPAG
jgi:NADP-dependent 3-hydroxy acid dehydrogenase YdfG